MVQIETYVFLDLETTGMPQEESNRTKITEISLIAVKREHVLETRPGASPRVQQKLSMCFNPGKMVHPDCTKVTGLCNDLLEHEPYFDITIFTIINNFLSVLKKPVCLIAQNGLNFDYPILKNHIDKLGVSLPEDLLCADCFHGFYDILEGKKPEEKKNTEVQTISTSVNNIKDASLTLQDIESVSEVDFVKVMKERNENTPKKDRIQSNELPPKLSQKNPTLINNRVSKARRKFPWSKGEKPTQKYKLKDIYERVLNRPALEAHRAESDCIMTLEISVALQQNFIKWVDNNYCSFSEINPMKIGVPLGD